VSFEVNGPDVPRGDEVLTEAALELVALLHREIDGRRKELLAGAPAELRALLKRKPFWRRR